jgi:hypothetical protein
VTALARAATFDFTLAAAAGGRELRRALARGERLPLRVGVRCGGREARPGTGGTEARAGDGGADARVGNEGVATRAGGAEICLGGRDARAGGFVTLPGGFDTRDGGLDTRPGADDGRPLMRTGVLRVPSTTISPPHFLHLILVSLPAKRVANRLSGMRNSTPQAMHEIVNVISRLVSVHAHQSLREPPPEFRSFRG